MRRKSCKFKYIGTGKLHEVRSRGMTFPSRKCWVSVSRIAYVPL